MNEDLLCHHPITIPQPASGPNRTKNTGPIVAAPTTFDQAELLVQALVQELAASRTLSDESFDRAAAVLDHAALMELITLVGYDDLLVLVLNVWRTELPAGEQSPFNGGADPIPPPATDTAEA